MSDLSAPATAVTAFLREVKLINEEVEQLTSQGGGPRAFAASKPTPAIANSVDSEEEQEEAEERASTTQPSLEEYRLRRYREAAIAHFGARDSAEQSDAGSTAADSVDDAPPSLPSPADVDDCSQPSLTRHPSEAEQLAKALEEGAAAQADDCFRADEKDGETTTVISTDSAAASVFTGDPEWLNVYWLRIKLGVRIFVKEGQSPSDPVDITVTASSRVAAAIAESEIRQILQDPQAFLTDAENRRRESLHVFVDNSNIFVGAQMVEDPQNPKRLVREIGTRVHIPRLIQVVEAGRDRDTTTHAARWQGDKPVRWVFGSKNNDQVLALENLWQRCGYTPVFVRRAKGEGEHLVDDGLIAQIMLTLAKYRDGTGRTLVLLTGDGNDNGGRASFLDAVDHAVAEGWKVEVWCWKSCAAKVYRERAANGAIKLRLLDSHRDHICFRHNKRVPGQQPLGSDGGCGGEQEVPDDGEEEDQLWMNCPITLELMQDPVRTPMSHGSHHFERMAIIEWVLKNNVCPLTRLPLKTTDLLPPDPDFSARLGRFSREGPDANGGMVDEDDATRPHLPIEPDGCTRRLLELNARPVQQFLKAQNQPVLGCNFRRLFQTFNRTGRALPTGNLPLRRFLECVPNVKVMLRPAPQTDFTCQIASYYAVNRTRGSGGNGGGVRDCDNGKQCPHFHFRNGSGSRHGCSFYHPPEHGRGGAEPAPVRRVGDNGGGTTPCRFGERCRKFHNPEADAGPCTFHHPPEHGPGGGGSAASAPRKRGGGGKKADCRYGANCHKFNNPNRAAGPCTFYHPPHRVPSRRPDGVRGVGRSRGQDDESRGGGRGSWRSRS
eukprot:INCI3472.1.p1 GENE.INCI3472.1~~INCI3472.1.p1  ORF type:complete len:833 (+),score=122.25 INCI3472.1:98-2596(+)